MRPKIKSYHKGWIGHDGNGMVGGKWANTTRLAYKDIPVEKLTECISDADKAEKCLSWLKERIGETFRVEAYFDVGYDHSVGIDSYCDLNEVCDVDDKVLVAIDLCRIPQEDKDVMEGWLQEICEDAEGYEFYDID